MTARPLLAIKDRLECHLCRTADNLFNLDNSIALFDLTNFYFEGAKRGSRKAQRAGLRAWQGEAFGLPPAGPGAVHQQGGLRALLLHP